jgi:DNA polymerase (family X)
VKDKLELARALREIALLLRVHGADRFRTLAYQRGADALEMVRGDLAEMVRGRRLTQIAGIGSGLAGTIAELYETGQSGLLERLRRGVPSGIGELLEIPALGPKKIMALHAALGIDDVEDLRGACESGRVREVPGFGAKTERAILEGIARRPAKEPPGALLYRALGIADQLVEHMRRAPGVGAVDVAGSVRRQAEIVADIDLVAAASDPAPVLDHLTRFPLVSGTVERSADVCRVRLAGGLPVDLAVSAPARYPIALHRETGSRAHLAKLEQIATRAGFQLLPRELRRTADGTSLEPRTEAEIYELLGMPFIPPELREGDGEIEAALEGRLPSDVVSVQDVRGLVHCHTVYSDGKNTIEEMARAAEAMGMRYITITDHSASAGYAGGLAVDRLERQWDEIARVQERVSVRLLRGTESDILADGSLDYPDRVLERLDVIIASIHSRMKMDSQTMTRRLVAAMRQPVFKIWGHALGRLLRKRPPIDCRVEEVLDTVAQSRAAIEINGDPWRLDLEPRWVRAARSRGIRFVISTDAHSTDALANVRFGVAMARRGWVRRGEVLNTMTADEFCAAVRPAA